MTEVFDRPQCVPGELWLPGLHCDAEFPVAQQSELVDAFSEYAQTDAMPFPGMEGVFTLPERPIRAIASVDLCEVVRETKEGLHELTGIEDYPPSSSYSDGTWYDEGENGTSYERSVVETVVRVLMNSGLIQPVEDIASITAIMSNWRERGIYVAANTATLNGCELATVKHTLGETMPGLFDALLLPRNYNSQGTLTKARALGVLATEAGLPLEDLPVVHIDDVAHHHAGFRDTYGEHHSLRLVGPKRSGLQPHEAHISTDTSYESFVVADDFFKREGVAA